MDYGYCECGGKLYPIWFTEYECKTGRKAGRKRSVVSHLVCEQCLKNHVVDDSFDGNWYY